MQQTTFSFSSSNAYDPTEYIESASNSFAYNAIINWPSGWGTEPYGRTLIIQAAKSSGKTFLAKKWAAKSGALFIEKTQALTECLLANHQTFIIDGFDNSWNEEQVLHNFNAIHENGKYLLITTTKIPVIKLPDLASRINASNKLKIALPDDELIKMLIFKLFSNHSVVISQEVLHYLIKILPREFPEIISSVAKINKFAMQNKRKITVPLIKIALGIIS